MSSSYIGIDFGTTKTLVSVYNEKKQEAEIIRLGRGRDDIPTSVYAAEDGAFLCGEAAEEQSIKEPMRYTRAFKMKLGSRAPLLSCCEGNDFKHFTAAELTQVFLSYVRKECEWLTGKKIRQAVITHPVRFSPQQVKQLEEAARVAGFEKLAFVTEPEAAAHTYCRHQSDDSFRNALVIDWGGGTLDMTLVSRSDDQIRTYTNYTDGIPKGGEDFDEALYRLIKTHYDVDNSVRLEGDMMNPKYNYTIRKTLRSSKEALSRLPQQTVRLSGSRGAYPAVKVQRAEFEKIILDDIETAANLASSLIKSISNPSLKPDKLILVGGSSRIPAVARFLQERTGLPCRTWDMSVEAVGLGAALVAAERWGKTNEGAQKVKIDREQASSLTKSKKKSAEASPKKSVESKTRSDRPLYKDGLAYMHGVGVKKDFSRAAEAFRKGAEAEELNAAYMLCHCFREGIGVPRNYDLAYQIAEYLAVHQNYYPAYYFMADAHRTGRGAGVDVNKAERYARALETGCKMPLKGVDEILRYDALLNNESSKPNTDWWRMERLSRDNMHISDLPQRYGWLAISLFKRLTDLHENSPSLIQEVRSAVDAGINSGDEMSCLLKSIIVGSEDNGIYPYAPQEAYKLMERAAKYGGDFSLLMLMRSVLTPAEKKAEYERLFWNFCNYGHSGLVDDNTLPCLITLQEHPYSALFKALDKEKTVALVNKDEAEKQLVAQASPFICVKNEGSQPLNNIVVRVCSTDGAVVDESISIEETIIPGDGLRIDMLHFGINFSNNSHLYVEVISGNKKASLSFDGVNMDYFRSPIPPIIMWHESGMFGGLVLKAETLDEDILPLSVKCTKIKSGASATGTQTGLGDEIPFGWCEFSDSSGLAYDEQFRIEVEGYGSVLGYMTTNESDAFLAYPPSTFDEMTDESTTCDTLGVKMYKRLNAFRQYDLILINYGEPLHGLKVIKSNRVSAVISTLKSNEYVKINYSKFKDQKNIGMSEIIRIVSNQSTFAVKINMRDVPNLPDELSYI